MVGTRLSFIMLLLVLGTAASAVGVSESDLWSSISSGSVTTQSIEDDDGDEDNEMVSCLQASTQVEHGGSVMKQAVAKVLPTSAFIQSAHDEIGKISAASMKVAHEEFGTLSAASVKEFSDLYEEIESIPGKRSQVYVDLMQKLSVQAPQFFHNLHLKGQLNYPYMHVANHQIVPRDTKLDRTVAAFAGKQSMLDDDRVVMTLVCFILVALSSFFNLRRGGKGDQSLPLSLHGEATSAEAESLSVWDGTISTFSSILGMGFLSLPYCMALAGWIAAPIIIFFVACTGYTAHLLTWAMQQEVQKANRVGKKVMPGWGFLLLSAYGPRAERMVNMFLIVELWGYTLSGIVATAMNLNMLIDEISVSSAIGITVLVQYILTNAPMKLLTKVNVVCNALFIACCFMFIVTGLMLPAKAPASELRYVKPEGLLAACGIIVFSPASHSLYPAIMSRMERPEQYPICIRRAYVLACIAYLGLAVPGYYLFGNACQPSAVQNIGADLNLVALPNLGWMNYVAGACMVMKISGLQPLIIKPLTATIESMLEGRVPSSVSATLVAPTVLTISAVVGIAFAHQMATLLNIVGSVFCMSIALVLPVLCYWKLKPQSVTGLQQVFFSGLIAVGGTFAVLGLITALDM